MSATSATTFTLTIPDPPFALGDIVFDKHTPARPLIVTGIEYRYSGAATWSKFWYWHITSVPADNLTARQHEAFDCDDLSREPWPTGGDDDAV